MSGSSGAAHVKLGVALGALNPAFHVEITVLADELGFESVWMPEHLVFPVEMSRSPYPGEDHPPVPPQTPVQDCFAYLCYLAGRTSRIRLGSHVYNLGLRHPFIAARAITTLDVMSGGRAEIGIGASWLESEWTAVGLDFATRGRRVDENLAVCKRLWTEEVVEHHGEFYDFGPVMFEPKPTTKPWPAIHVGGESPAALRRAARDADGWIGMSHTLESVAGPVERLRALRAEHGTAGGRFEVTVGGPVSSRDDLARWRDAGVDRLIVSPWKRSREAADGLKAFAGLAFG
jgi:probable F420-dependent oxidoreductase